MTLSFKVYAALLSYPTEDIRPPRRPLPVPSTRKLSSRRMTGRGLRS